MHVCILTEQRRQVTGELPTKRDVGLELASTYSPVKGGQPRLRRTSPVAEASNVGAFRVARPTSWGVAREHSLGRVPYKDDRTTSKNKSEKPTETRKRVLKNVPERLEEADVLSKETVQQRGVEIPQQVRLLKVSNKL